MRTVVIHSPHDLRIDSADDPPAPGPGEARIRLANGGICGSDLHYYHQGGFGAVRIREPMILGHEASAVVEETGAGVDDLKPGDRVAINPSMPCGRCRYCRRDMRNACQDMRFAGSAMRFPHQQGLFRDRMTLPAAQLVRLKPEADLRLAACAEPLAVCLHAANRAGPLLGRRVLVSGSGPIGCLMVVAARHAGAHTVIATDLSAAALAIAARLGASETVDMRSDPRAYEALAAGRGTLDVVFECSGAAAALQGAFTILRPGGVLVVLGLGSEPAVPLSLAVTKEIEMRGSFRFDREFALAASLIDDGAVDVGPLVTGVLPVEAAREAFELASDRDRAMKVQLEFAP